MEEFLEMHSGGAPYELFVKEFLKRVVGEKTWKSSCYRSLLSEYCTASGEAFALLTLENNYDRWEDMAKTGDYADKNGTAPEALYTNSGKSNNGKGAPKRFQGWSTDGYARFDALYNLVKLDRAKLTRTAFEENLKSDFEEEFAKKPSRPSLSKDDEDDSGAYPSHDFEDVEKGGTENLVGIDFNSAGGDQPDQNGENSSDNEGGGDDDQDSDHSGDDEEGGEEEGDEEEEE